MMNEKCAFRAAARCRGMFGVLLVIAVCFAGIGAGPAQAAQSLASAFAAAGPGAGYDTFVSLDPAIVYKGGLDLPAGRHCILGNGAAIDLSGSSVVASTDVTLDVFGCTFMRGDTGLDFSDGAIGLVMGCNFFKNVVGLKYWTGTALTVVNNNFVQNTHYGVYRHEDIFESYIAYNNMWENTDGDYIYYCPG